MHVPDPMEAPGLRWGILAPGGIARRFAREVGMYTKSTIQAVGSRDLGRAQLFVEDNFDEGVKVTAHGSYEELVADEDVDAVYVCSPHGLHHDHAILALEAGKPVLVEKAFTLNARQAEEVFAVAERQGLFAMEAMWSRFLPHYQSMRELVDTWELGEVRSVLAVHAQNLDLKPEGRMMDPKLGGGALLDLGIYPLSLMHFLLGVPDAIHANGIVTRTGVDLRENITLTYGNQLGVAYTDMGLSARCSLQVLCDRGRLEVHDWFYTPSAIVVETLDGDGHVIPNRVPGGFEYEAAEAARCISEGKQQSSIMKWQDTVEVMEMADEVRRQLGVVYPDAD